MLLYSTELIRLWVSDPASDRTECVMCFNRPRCCYRIYLGLQRCTSCAWTHLVIYRVDSAALAWMQGHFHASVQILPKQTGNEHIELVIAFTITGSTWLRIPVCCVCLHLHPTPTVLLAQAPVIWYWFHQLGERGESFEIKGHTNKQNVIPAYDPSSHTNNKRGCR